MWSPIVKWLMIILVLRGILGIYQDCNFWWRKEFNIINLKSWFDTFKR